jgi:hypothetical protein
MEKRKQRSERVIVQGWEIQWTLNVLQYKYI